VAADAHLQGLQHQHQQPHVFGFAEAAVDAHGLYCQRLQGVLDAHRRSKLVLATFFITFMLPTWVLPCSTERRKQSRRQQYEDPNDDWYELC
jgi:hypothetical protein